MKLYKMPGGGTKGIPGKPGVAPTPPQPPRPPKMKPIPPLPRRPICQASTPISQAEAETQMKTPPIVITLGGKAYSVRIRSEHLDRFYEIVRTAAPNKVLNSSPLLDDELTEEL